MQSTGVADRKSTLSKVSVSLPDPDKLAAALFPSVMKAGREIMAVFKSGAVAETKADGSPVTAADRLAEEILLDALASIAPGVPVIAEERNSLGHSVDCEDEFFLVDPLDGTREFAARRPEFTVNVALIRDRRPVFGLIYAPALNQLYWTAGGRHAFEASVAPDVGDASLSGLGATALRTRDVAAAGLTIVASRSHGSDALETWLATVDACQRTNIGSSLKFCLVARGAADLYPRFGPTKEWDTAAGHAIATAAGGDVTNIDGSAFLYGKAESDYLNPGFIVWSRPQMLDAYRSGALARKG